MAIIAKPYTFSVGATIVAAEHNSNFDTIYNAFNGNIDNSNISGSASFGNDKLAQITTAGKVSGTSLTLLNNIPSGAGVIPAANLTSVAQKGTNSDITSLTACTQITGMTTPLTVAQGGTGDTTGNNLVKGWASITYSGGTPTLNDSFNVSGITDNGTGDLTVTWDTDFASANYAVVATCKNAHIPFITAIAAGSVRFTINNASFSAADPQAIYIMAIGDQ